jgi:hypothetical protein
MGQIHLMREETHCRNKTAYVEFKNLKHDTLTTLRFFNVSEL